MAMFFVPMLCVSVCGDYKLCSPAVCNRSNESEMRLGRRQNEKDELPQTLLRASRQTGKHSTTSRRSTSLLLALNRSERHSVIMKNLAGGILTWAQPKRSVETKEGMAIGRGEITKPLSNLEDAGFVAKCEEGTYFVPDPMAVEVIAKG